MMFFMVWPNTHPFFLVVYGCLFSPFVVVGLVAPVSGVFGVFRLVVACCRFGYLFASPSGVGVIIAHGAFIALIFQIPYVDKIPLYVDFICIFADKFVTLQYSYKVSSVWIYLLLISVVLRV